MNDNQKAASILRQYAGELYQGHTIGGQWDGEHIKAEHDELIALADRLAQGGEAVAYRDEAGTLYPCAESVRNYMPKGRTATPLHTHPAPTDSGRVAELEAQLERMDNRLGLTSAKNHDLTHHIAALEQQLTESREREGRMREALEKVQPLARRTLWLAFVWNDHNFTHPLDYARSEAKQQGFNCLEDAQEFLADLSKDMAFDFALKPQQTADKEKNDE